MYIVSRAPVCTLARKSEGDMDCLSRISRLCSLARLSLSSRFSAGNAGSPVTLIGVKAFRPECSWCSEFAYALISHIRISRVTLYSTILWTDICSLLSFLHPFLLFICIFSRPSPPPLFVALFKSARWSGWWKRMKKQKKKIRRKWNTRLSRAPRATMWNTSEWHVSTFITFPLRTYFVAVFFPIFLFKCFY